MKTRSFSTLIIGFLLMALVTDAAAQRRSTRTSSRSSEENTRGRKEKSDVLQKLAADIYVGSLFGGIGGFVASYKLGLGYKITDELTAGLGFKGLHLFPSDANTDRITNYGYYPYVRYKFGPQFYAKAEYDFYTYAVGQVGEEKFSFPMLGGGYLSGFGDWSFGFEAMILLDNREVGNTGFRKSAFYQTFIDYYACILYNF